MNNKDIDAKNVYDIAKKHFLFPSEKMNGVLEEVKIGSLLEKNERRINTKLFSRAYGFPKSQFNALKWIMMTSELKGNSKLVELTIASYYNLDKGFAFPSQELVGYNTGLSSRTISNAVTKMKESGRWLVKQSFSDGKARATNCYFILPPLGYGSIAKSYKENASHSEINSSLETALENVVKEINHRAKTKSPRDIISVEHVSKYSLIKEGQVYKHFPKLFKSGDKENQKIFSTILNRVNK